MKIKIILKLSLLLGAIALFVIPSFAQDSATIARSQGIVDIVAQWPLGAKIVGALAFISEFLSLIPSKNLPANGVIDFLIKLIISLNLKGGAKALLPIILLLGISIAASAQSIFKPIPKPAQAPVNRFARATVVTPSGDSVFTGFRLSGLTVLYGVSNGYTASNVYAGTGFGWEHDTYSSKTQRWNTDFQVGAGFYAGGHIAPANLQAATAVGLHIALLNKQLIIGLLYNLNSPAGMKSHWVGAVGGNAYLIPTN